MALIATAVVAALLVAAGRRWGDTWAVPAGRALAVADPLTASPLLVARGSLLEFMGPWPVYILVAALLALVMFLALAALARPTSARSLHGTIGRKTG